MTTIPRINTPDGLFKDGNPVVGAPGTVVTAEWLNAVQAALASVVFSDDLSSAINSSATDVAANSLAVKKAYDKAVEALNASKSVIYDPTKRYLAGEIVFICDDPNQPHIGNWYEAYHPDGCQGKDPRDPENRPDGWTNTDPAAPYYWLKHGKWIEQATIGAAVPIQRTTVSSQLYIKYRNDGNLHKDKFWRLAEVYPELINNDIITLADLRAEFIRGLDDGRGADAGREMGSWQKPTLTIVDPTYTAFFVMGLTAQTSILSKEEYGGDVVDTSLYKVIPSYIGGNAGTYSDFGIGVGGTRPRNIAMLYQLRF